ncbi:E3 ubiquitin-protein ligase at3g02290 [Phtheirospermum japonicum]|uniref:RING-type E3 ubiquitin transferase n=1 Tax=Phtheirospermum japonicum TaxID=374723 RepID=A0A830CCH3_9LAMI|nr:E3 ubiquitin-protein ligase at3g02290 [Phtheirospermum japonicum]
MQYSPASEEYESLTSQDSVATLLNSRVLIDLNLNMSIPDTFRAPPAPTPYDVVLGGPQSTDVKASHTNLKEVNRTARFGFLPTSPRKAEINPLNVSTANEEEDDDVCPTCLEEYDLDNPKIMTKCNHHFHLSCILEWQERSDTCPICDQEMIYESPSGVDNRC